MPLGIAQSLCKLHRVRMGCFSGRTVILSCKTEPDCQSLTLRGPVLSLLVLSFDSLGTDFVCFIKNTSVSHREGLKLFSKKKKKKGAYYLCFLLFYSLLCLPAWVWLVQIECHLLFRHSLISKQGMQFQGILSKARFVCFFPCQRLLSLWT